VVKVIYTLMKSHVIFSQPCELTSDPSRSVGIYPEEFTGCTTGEVELIS
jgi:hypothetical protein